MKDRIKQLMTAQHMTQQTFADLIGISAASLSSIFNDRSKPTLNHVDAIKKKFPTLNLEWLLYGVGPMYREEKNDINRMSEKKNASMTPESTAEINSQGSSPLPYPHIGNTVSGQQRDLFMRQEKAPRQITEIRIFFDDQTWETFVPKK